MEKIEIEIYHSPQGFKPFENWLENLSVADQLLIDQRIARLRAGNLGDWKSLKNSLCEIRIHESPGYRIYFCFINLRTILLVYGGNKKSQERDIKKALFYFNEYKREN